MSAPELVHWAEDSQEHSAPWRSANGAPAPESVVPVDDTITARDAYDIAAAGTAMLWRGDYQNARQMLRALLTRADGRQRPPAATALEQFRRERATSARRARIGGSLLVPMDPGHIVPLRRAPDVAAAAAEAYGDADTGFVLSLRELGGAVGAHQWRLNGVPVDALGADIVPHFGVFAPTRSEYLDLVAHAPLPGGDTAFDIGTGTGVLAAILAKRGVARVIGSDTNPRAIACANENFARLGLAGASAALGDFFPEGRASLIVCNPPWLPATAVSPLDTAVYDENSGMLRGFLAGLPEHLLPGGEGWLIISDLAERLGLRGPDELTGLIAAAGLRVIERHDTHPRHPRARDASDPLHTARSAEVTSLWRLGVA